MGVSPEAFALSCRSVLGVLGVALIMALAVAMTALALLYNGAYTSGAGSWKTKEELATLRKRAAGAGKYEAFSECWEGMTPEERQRFFGYKQWPPPEEEKKEA